MKLLLLVSIGFIIFFSAGCASKEFTLNKIICPSNINQEQMQADLTQCRYYDLDAINKSSKAPITIECQKCLENKGYKIEKE